MSNAETSDRGSERFIDAFNQEQFDYTKWRENLFEDMTLEELNQAAVQYNKDHPFTGKAVVI